MASDVVQVYTLWNEYAAACQAGDLDRWMSLWADEGMQLAPDGPPRVGKGQIREAMRPVFELFFMSNVIINTGEVRILGDSAYSHGEVTFNRSRKVGGELAQFSGKFLDILKKEVDGSWKISIDCHNYNETASEFNAPADHDSR